MGNLGCRGLPRGRLRSLGTFSCGCPSGGRRAWDLCPLFVPARTGGNRGDHPELSLGPLGPPFFHNMGLCGRPGGDPKAWKHFGPELDPGMRALHKAPGRRGILGRGLRGGGPGRPPFWRTLISPTERWGWTPVSLKINTRHTHRVCVCPCVCVCVCVYVCACALGGRAHDICRLPAHTRARGRGHGRSRTQRPDVCPLCQRCQCSHYVATRFHASSPGYSPRGSRQGNKSRIYYCVPGRSESACARIGPATR